MKKLTLTTLILLMLAWTGVAQESISARSFTLKHKTPEAAAAVVKSLMTAEGSFSIQPGKESLVITDRKDVLERIAAVIEEFDAPPRLYSIELVLVSAGREASPPAVPRELRELSEKLSGVLRFNSFRRIGGSTVAGREGDSSVLTFDGHRASFDFGEYDPVSGSLRIEQFRLDRVDGDAEGRTLLETSLNLRVGQTVVLGAARQPDAGRALMIVVRARE